MTALPTRGMAPSPRFEPAELIGELTRLALSASSKVEFRGRALGLLARTLLPTLILADEGAA
ncbi:MAG TPA: hypothetical protein VFE93_10050, partial [Myxococcaceae bacterium]|nr:hypothetical protein [Myxococcaceae bacterium]